MTNPNAEPDEITLDGSDPIGDHFQTEDDAKQEIAACFETVSKLVGKDAARQLFADFLSAVPAPKGRPSGMAWTRYHKELFLADGAAPKGQKVTAMKAIAERHKKDLDAAKQDLKRLRKDWRALGAADQQWLMLDWFQPPASPLKLADAFPAVQKSPSISEP
jgi:hypothetical protein